MSSFGTLFRIFFCYSYDCVTRFWFFNLCYLSGWQVDGISYLETIGKSEQVLDAEYGNLSTTELRKLTDFGSAQAIQPLESHDEAAGMINDRSREQSSSVDSASVQADNFHLNVPLRNLNL